MEERRKYERLNVEELQSKCNIKCNRNRFSLEIFDLSPDGIGFVTPASISTGQEFDIELNLEDEKVFCKAMVCWIKPDVIDRRKTIGGMRFLITNLCDQSKLLISYTNRLLDTCPLPNNFKI